MSKPIVSKWVWYNCKSDRMKITTWKTAGRMVLRKMSGKLNRFVFLGEL